MTRSRAAPARSVLVAAVLAGVLLIAGCGGLDGSLAPSARPPATPVPSAAPIGAGGAAARDELFAAIRAAGLQVDVSNRPFRPPEAAELGTVPRAVYQVLLPANPDGGFITVYELPDEATAIQAAKAQHAYLTSGPGRVQSPLGTDRVLQQLGPTVIYYEWLPAATTDPLTPRIADVLRTVGTSFALDP